MDSLTHIIYQYFRLRHKQIDRYAEEAGTIQNRQLMRLVRKAARTSWGEKQGYRDIKSYSDFKNRFPVQSYDRIKEDVKRMINGERDVLWPGACQWFAKSSGTTSDKSKFLPVTPDILKHCHYQGGFDTVSLYLRNHPESRFFRHKGLILGGSHSPSPLNGKTHCGDLSAVLLQNLNPLVNLIRVPKKETILMDEWESKIKAIVEQTCREDVGNISGVPSWPSDRMHYMETYNASEGFFGIQNDPDDHSLLLMLDYDIFYEFVPVNELDSDNPQVIPLEEVELGKNYAMVITTSGGLWRYLIGDTVCFTSLRPYKFVISGRTKHFINAFGEELMVNNADRGIRIACQKTGAIVKEYTAAPLFLLDKAKGRHQWLIEFEKEPASLPDFARILDEALKSLNSDYEAKRYKEISLQPLEVIVAREGLFYDWLQSKGKLGGQHKIPRLSNSRTFLEELLTLQGISG